MPTLEERVSYGEGRMQDFSVTVGELRAGQSELRTMIDARFAHVESRFNQLETRLTQIDARFAQVDQRGLWLVGLQFATLLAVIAALAGAYYR